MELALMGVSLAIAVVGLLFARWIYLTKPSEADRMVERFGGLHTLVYNKYWIDELYDFLFVNSIVNFSRLLWKRFDEAVIDGIVNGVARVVRGWGSVLRQIETGLVKDYALSILVGALAVIGYLVLK
jgi:NADH-quinone oxidoreductase subunit L